MATDIDIVPLTLLGIFVTLVFLTGGGARADIQSLLLLRPISILFVGIALLRLKRQEIVQNQFLFSMLASIVGLTIFHLIPLPPQIWHLLPGRTLTADIDNAVGLESQWRPLSLVPTATWNGLFSLAVPTAVFLMIIKVNNRYWTQLLALLLLIGLLSGLVGLLQSIGSSKGALYFYRITNNGAAVGLFANRNHQAMFLSCLFPMLAVFASTGVRTPAEAKRKLWLALASGCLLIPLILVTGSRAGLVTASIGLLSVLSLYRKPLQPTPSRRFRDRLNLRTIYCVSGAIVFALMLFLTTRASSLLQLSLSDEADELRFQMWGPIWEMTKIYMPWGSGIGSFVEIYRVHEPSALLSTSYRNHAHNDWLEITLTGGIPALLILLAAIFAYLRVISEILKPNDSDYKILSFARLGVVVLLILAIGSIGDYPLRTPSLAGLFVIAAIWASNGLRAARTAVIVTDKWA